MRHFPLLLALFLASTAAFERAFGETVALQNIEIDGKTHRYVILTLPPPETTFGGNTKVSYSFNNTKVEATIKTLPPNLKSVVKDILSRRSQSHQWSRILAEESAEAEKILAEAQRLAEEGKLKAAEESDGSSDKPPSNNPPKETAAAKPGHVNYQMAYSQARKAKLSGGKGKININTATKEELMRIPGVGERRAWLIYNYRPIKNLEELMHRCSMSKKAAEKLEKHIIYGGSEE
jgi:DNA uptake protein ComE-like DNA-binding protein